MAKRPITKEIYDKLLESFRSHPGEFARAGRAAAVDSRTAKRGLEKGWPKQNSSWVPISEVLEAEVLATRAHLREVAQRERIPAEAIALQAEREKAAADALEARGQEAQMVRILRTDVTNQLAAVARLLPGMGKWTQWAAETMKTDDPKSIREVTKMMDAISKVTDRTATAADRVMAMERRLLGQPEMVVGHVMADITMEEAVEHIEASARTLEYARECGLLPPAKNFSGEADIVDAEIVADEESSPLEQFDMTDQAPDEEGTAENPLAATG